ncbi:hypothetical protein SLS62_010666 [Diatrype stigma]|uniref:Xylanolytic transcriptional activator regulatory domain-containing protein n=1 Tax=Diatrype stigma TaxID=117547 RepID=A0AAN9YG06_9PEZI
MAKATWIEVEERRRTWWAVYIMDKIVSLGSRKRPLYSDPPLNEILPVEDAAWDLGDIGGAIQGTLSSPFREPQSTFGRLCQGSLLASRILELSKRLKDTCGLNCGGQFDYSEVTSLVDSTHELSTSIQAEVAARPASYFGLIPAQCLAYSVMMKALSLICSAAEASTDTSASGLPPSMEMGMGMHAWAAAGENNNVPSLQQTAAYSESRRKAVSEQVRDLAKDLLVIIGGCAEGEMVKTSPFVLDAMYSAATVSQTAWKSGAGAGSDPSTGETSHTTTRELLARLSDRWRLGVEYLNALDQHGVNAVLGQGFPGGSNNSNSSNGGQTIPLVQFSSSASAVAMPAIVC